MLARLVQQSILDLHQFSVKFPSHQKSAQSRAAFTLVEMLVVISIMAILIGAGVTLLGGTGVQSRKAGADMISGMVDQARTIAITTRKEVFLVIAEPGTLAGQDERYRIGLMRESVTPTTGASPVPDPNLPVTRDYELVRRWQTLNTGVILIGGGVDNIPNPLDAGKVDFTYTSNQRQITARVYQLSINSLGSLTRPAGSTPVVLRLAEGAYRNGKPSPNKVAGGQGIAETQLKIGRVMARPYRSN